MANKWASDQITDVLNAVQGGSAVAGLGGAPSYRRATELRGIIKVQRFTIAQDSPNPMPGSSVGDGFALGDAVIIALLSPVDRIYFGRVYNNAWGGTALQVKIGKIDPNNSSNTDDDHYLAVTNIETAGVNDINLNIGEQVGADPAGDNSVGNKLPHFGAQPIQITATVSGTTLATGGTIEGYILYVEEGN